MQNAVLPEAPASVQSASARSRYAQCIAVSKRVRWDIDRDVIRGRSFDFSRKFLPDALSRAHELDFLAPEEQALLSRIQGRTYANMFALAERFIGAKILDMARGHGLGDQTALEALVRFTDEELKHQELFRRIEALAARGMPEGYAFVPRANDVAWLVLGKSNWAVLALTCMIELYTQAHYRASIAPDPALSELFKDVFLFHWREESQHAILDELEWRREDARLSAAERETAVSDLIDLVGAFDAALRQQARADTDYFLAMCGRALPPEQSARVAAIVLKAYRWQYILSGVHEERFHALLETLATPEQCARIGEALAPLAEGLDA